MRFSVLAPLQVHDPSGRPVGVGGARLRTLLVLLLVRPGRSVAVEELIDTIWDEDVPTAAGNALQALVSRLRRSLGVEAPLLSVTAPVIGWRSPPHRWTCTCSRS